jgi:hypothetical protein
MNYKSYALIITLFFSFVSFAGDNKFISTSGDVKLKKKSKSVAKAVIIYLSPNEIPDSAKRIGIIYNTERDQETAFEQVKVLASRAGGNAIFFVGGKSVTAGEKVFNNFVWPGAFKARWNFLVFYDPNVRIPE